MKDAERLATEKSEIQSQLVELLHGCSVDQLRYILARLNHSSKSEAANAIGLEADTIYHWPNEIEQAIALAIMITIYDAMTELSAASTKAACTLLDVLDSESGKERVNAALEILRIQQYGFPRISWSAIRWAVLKRDKFRCVFCGADARGGSKLEIDHLVPRSKGGTDSLDNLVTSCTECNRAKRDEVLPPDLLFQLSPHEAKQERTTENSRK